MKALISGGGVCGPVTAMALQRVGIEAVVYEARRAASNDAGSYLTIATNGLDALRAIAAHRRVLNGGFPTNRTVLLNPAGRSLASVPIGSARDGYDVSHTIKRAHLHQALFEEAHDSGVRVEFGKRMIGARVTGTGVEARFDDGSEVSGDLLIGCDGIHSVTRTIIDPLAPRPRYLGLLNFGGYTPGLAAGEAQAWHMIFGRRAFFGYAPDGNGGTVWFANVPRHAASREERDSTSIEQWRRWLLALVADDSGPAHELISTGELQLVADNTHDLPKVLVWHRDRAIIIGDAAHAPSPSSGQGASTAIEDAVVLAKCLRDASGIEAAFAAFERLRRQRVERIVRQGARSSATKVAGPLGRMVRDLVMPLVLRNLATEKSMAWIYEHHIDWQQPTIMAHDG
jgi:2-polyprenyl-6-methoxyphenol hydroxylase-like FAD-dependent oxidoreductase